MLSGTSGQKTYVSVDRTISEIKIQTSILKAIHDFLEEQDFKQILPETLKNLSHKLFNPFQSGLNVPEGILKNDDKERDNIPINHQLLIGHLDLDKIYTISTRETNLDNTSFLRLELESLDFLEVLLFLEKLMRRIKVDIENKNKSSLNSIKNPTKWENKFPVISRHDIELEFGDNWKVEATNEFEYPFFVSCVKPEFIDSLDPERQGFHYLNFELYFPKFPKPVAKGSQREYRFQNLINQMSKLGINRFDYRNYLLNVAEGNLFPSSGVSLYLDNLVKSYLS